MNQGPASSEKPKVTIGLERFLDSANLLTGKEKIGLLTNQASVDRQLRHNRIVLQDKFGTQLTTLFSPQHGFYSEQQDNMIESDHDVDDQTGLPIYSLYGEVRKPTREMFENLDVVIIDLLDVGTRVYTFLYTMAYCLEAASEFDKKVIVLDRPNPIGGALVEGNLLDPACASFVGLYPLPMRHGMTFGELALYINGEFGIGADLEVVAMAGWQRSMDYRESCFPWVFPSPNMPTPATALVYPGQVIWEGTNISEGRGTTLPFEIFGSPFLEHERFTELLEPENLPGCLLRPLRFIPTSGKWANELCHGFQLHVTDRDVFRPYRTSLLLLQKIMLLYPEDFRYKQPPYEYEYNRLPMDCILGSENLRSQIEAGTTISELEKQWQPDLKLFVDKRQKYLLY